MKKYDVVILGGGPAGRTIVHMLHQRRAGLSVLLIKDEAVNILGERAAFPGVVNASASMVFDWGFGAAGVTEAAAHHAGFDVLAGLSDVLDRYPMMDGASSVVTKLVFDRASRRLLGGLCPTARKRRRAGRRFPVARHPDEGNDRRHRDLPARDPSRTGGQAVGQRIRLRRARCLEKVRGSRRRGETGKGKGPVVTSRLSHFLGWNVQSH